jgi:hypothetical protein
MSFLTTATSAGPHSGAAASAPLCGGVPCKPPRPKKAVTARIVSLTFRSDHLDAAGKKLLKKPAPTPPPTITIARLDYDYDPPKTTNVTQTSDLGDGFTDFLKPEWDAGRAATDVQPVSHTKNKNVTVDVEIEFTVTPTGQTAHLTSVRGVCRGHTSLSFAAKQNRTVGTGRVTLTGLVSEGKLPNFVTWFEKTITWSAVVDGKRKALGTSGPHRVYVTFDTPGGKMGCPSDNEFREDVGPEQVVTEPRLKFSVEGAERTGRVDEKECVDALFRHISYVLGVGYVLARRWVSGPNTTGVTPKPTLHHYLWLCNTGDGQGECHNIAAAFALACKIVGVKGPFEVGYMHPWSSRFDIPPSYPKRGDHILGRYNNPCTRTHALAGHDWERVVFLDHNDMANNFEGVARYRNALYAIGDAVFDRLPSPDENASTYFAVHDREHNSSGGLTGKIVHWDLSKGYFLLQWVGFSTSGAYLCKQPYPPSIALPPPANPAQAHTFKWET